MTVKTRFAPSPTGRLHLGNIRTALFNWLLARGSGGSFVLRIEDTDAERSEPEHVEALCEDLQWLGLDWQEGLKAGGQAGPYAQSERAAIYEEHFRRLHEAGLAYPCFCSREQLERARAAQRAAGKPPRYPGTCAKLSAEEAERRLAAGEAATLRFRVPPGREIRFEDRVRGPQSFASDDIGDFVIRRADGSPAFFFSNAVDDALMDITHVLRGEDHLANTPRQLLLLEALDLPAPAYGHIPLVLAEDGAPLSKRAGALSLAWYREKGLLPRAILNYLARLGHHYAEDRLLDETALARGFDLARVGKAPARFDNHQLEHWQREAVLALNAADCRAWLGPAVERAPAETRDQLAAALQPNVLYPYEAAQWTDILFGPGIYYSQPAREVLRQAGEGFFTAALEAVDRHGADCAAVVEAVGTATGARGKALYQPLRLALTGRSGGPELAQLFELLGAERIRERLERARAQTA